ncbi:InlB B-repeat-containing protein [Anaerotignum lactatifermentans]|uniref:InlB B-repeat-containing protein n=1 Tax=Anaerotignum lactatifermentans TaxID=160404 RepID=A0ABS2G7K3_9FIRM|nr:InlB B-repeat-containing protein [Anaerotignum lactatifermentans]MBM6829299.1 InlB B-repeat-containing protein [Anaerotignum lactatifermentans]MBM6877461.1 InlB B-repeat-containing protein [Anaerotignum lactatifermentans]
MKKSILNWCVILSLVFSLLPVPAGAVEGDVWENENTVTETAQCTCGALPDENGVILHEDGCPCAVSGIEGAEPGTEGAEPGTEGTEPETEETEPNTEGAEPGTEETEPGTEGTEPGTEGTEPETEETEPETEGTEPETEGTEPETEGIEPATEAPVEEIEEEEMLEELETPALMAAPLDEENSSDMVLTVEGEWDSYAWESCIFGFWSQWEGDGPSLILSKEDFVSYGFRCVVTLGDQSVTSEEFAYDPSVMERPMLMANTFSSGTLVDRSDHIRYYQSGNRFDIQGVDGGETFKTTYRDKGYRTAISVNGGSKVDIPYQLGDTSVGSSLTAKTTLDLAYGGRYVKITYTVKNNGSATQKFQIGSSADVMIDNNDRAEVKPTGTGLSMDGNPLNDYKFSLVAPDCDTLWFGNYYKAYENMFVNQDSLSSYSGDSGMAWSWSGTIAPGQTWSRYVLIGAGDLPEAPQAPTLNIDTESIWKVGQKVSISGAVSGTPVADSVTVSIGGWEYTGEVQPDGSFSIEIEVPELPEGETAFTYWSTTEEGGISDIKSQSVTIVPKPYVRLTTDSVSVMEDDADLDETKLKSYIQASYGTVTLSPESISADTPGEYSVVYTATDGTDTEQATLKVTVQTRPAALTAATVTDQGEDFSLSATMQYTGGLTFTETGFVYGALQNPTLNMNDGKATTGSVVNTKGGSMTALIDKDQLTYGISYYARAYAKTSDGTVVYGAQSGSFGIGNPDYGKFSVAYTKTEGNTSTFTISRDGADGEQTVYYRTVNGSAVGGTHFAHQADSVTFKDGETVKTVTVTEYSVSSVYDNNAATAYANADRTYSFEIYRVTGGATIASGTAVREMTKDANKTIDRGLFNTYQTSVNPSGETARGDYDGTSMGWTNGTEGNNAKVTISFGTGNYIDYMKAVAQNVQYKVSFQAKEVNDGYQHIQIVPGSGIDLGYYPYQGSWNGTMTTVVYAATFEHGGSTKNTSYAAYTFPNANGSVPNLKQEKWKDDSNNGNGCVLLPVDTTQLTVGFGASGDDKDEWTTKNVTHYLKYLDTKEPTLLGVAPMAGGSYLPGDSVTVALVFDEIVDSANSNLNNVSIETSWGTFAYAGGADTNVLYFNGTVTNTASGNLTVTAIKNASDIKDMAEDTGTDTSGTVSDGNSGAQLGNGADAPTVNVSAINNTDGTLTATITAANAGKLEYVWSTETDSSKVVGWQMLTDTANATVSTRQTSGTWYLYARATNGDGVTVYGCSSINLDAGGETVQLPSLTVTADNENWTASRMVNIKKSPSTATVEVKTPDGTENVVTGDSYTAMENGIYTFTLTSGEETITQAVNVSKIDNIAPTVEISDLDNTAHIENVTLTVRVSDAQSGIQTVTGQWQDGTEAVLTPTDESGVYQTATPGAGSWTLHVTVMDAVGNTASDTSNTYTVNLSQPTITVVKKGDSGDGVTYEYTITKGGSDIVSVQLPDGFELEEGVSLPADNVSGSLTFRESGTYTIIVRDEAGHVVTSDPMTVEIQQDLIAPEVRLSPSALNTTGTLTVYVSVVEMGSMPTMTVNGSAITPKLEEAGIYSGSFEVNAAGTYTVTAKDTAGNEGTDSITVYSVTFAGEGQSFPAQLAVAGNNAVDPGKPVRTGYIFDGWYKDETAWDFASSVEENITLTARWTAEAAAAPVVTKGNDVTQSYGTKDGTVSVEVAETAGYTYSYQWYSNTTNSAVDGTMISGATSPSYPIPEDTMVGDHYYYCVVTAQRQDNQETAQTTSGVITVTIEKAAQNAPGEKEGYTIDYQNENISIQDGYEIYTQQTGGTKLTDGAKIAPGDTLYIRRTESDVLAPSPWTTITIPNRPDAPDGITKTDETIQNKSDGTVSGILEGMEYRVDGGAWESGPATLTNLPAGTAVSVRYQATADQFYSEETTVTILDGTGTLTVTFNTAGGTEVEDVKVSVYGTAIIAPETSRTGYELDGWYLDGKKWDFESNTVTENMTLTAKWNLVSYTITYDLDGGSLVEGESNPASYTVETETFSLHNPTKTGYVFAGWTEEGSTEPKETVTISQGTTGDKTYIAQWTLAEFAVTVTADKTSAIYGESITLTAAHNHTADGMTYTYQWYKNDSTTPIADESDYALILSDVSQSGTYHVVITAADGVQKKESTSNEVTVSIEKKTITATWSGLEQVYGEKEPVTATLSGTEAGDDVTARVDGVLESAGEHLVTAVLEGEDAGNYTLKNNTATLKIQKKSVVITVTNNAAVEGEVILPTISAPGLNESDYEVIYKDKDGNKVSSPTEPGSYEVWVTFPDDSNYRHPDGSSEKQVGTFLISEVPPVLYTVNFAEAGDSMAGMQGAGGSTLTLPECGFTKQNALFMGWLYNGKIYQPGDSFTMPYGNVTFTAQWQSVFEVRGTVTEETEGTDTPMVSGAVVSLWLGANKLGEVTTKEGGSFEFEKLVPGIYNLVVTKDERTVTKKVEISSEDKTCEAVLPKGATNSIVEVAPGSPDMVVGNLDRIFENTDTNVYTKDDQKTVDAGGKVEITFAAETKQQEDVSADLEKIEAEKNSRDILGLVIDYTLEKEVFDQNGDKKEDASGNISQSNVLLEILLPLPVDMQGKNSYSVYRVHEEDAQVLTTTPSADLGEYFTVNSDKTVLTLYVKCFSTYAIGYQEKPKKHDNSEEAAAVTETIRVEETAHGSVSIQPEQPKKGDTVILTLIPEEGYTLEEIAVTDADGKTVELTLREDGTYSYEQPDGTVTIKATFQPVVETPDCPRDESCPMADFFDVDLNAWYHDGVHYCLENGLMAGTGTATFSPEETTSRAMIVAILYRLAGSPAVEGENPFTDVSEEAYYRNAVVWAVEKEVASGYGNGAFGPNDPITREQLAVMLYHYAKAFGYDTDYSSDAAEDYRDYGQVSAYAREALNWAVDMEIIHGNDDGTLAPKGGATRAEAATMLLNFCEKIEG